MTRMTIWSFRKMANHCRKWDAAYYNGTQLSLQISCCYSRCEFRFLQPLITGCLLWTLLKYLPPNHILNLGKFRLCFDLFEWKIDHIVFLFRLSNVDCFASYWALRIELDMIELLSANNRAVVEWIWALGIKAPCSTHVFAIQLQSKKFKSNTLSTLFIQHYFIRW